MRNIEHGALKKSLKTRWLPVPLAPLLKKDHQDEPPESPMPHRYRNNTTLSQSRRRRRQPPIKRRRPIALARGWLPADAGRRRDIRRYPDSPSSTLSPSSRPNLPDEPVNSKPTPGWRSLASSEPVVSFVPWLLGRCAWRIDHRARLQQQQQ